jgi:hypothetical protein
MKMPGGFDPPGIFMVFGTQICITKAVKTMMAFLLPG